MSRFLSIAQKIGEIVEQKNAAYGSSFEKAGSALRLLYPDGIAPDQMDDALLIARIWDKLQRIATDRDALGESPYGDITGYGILGVAMHRSAPKQPHQGVRVAPRKVQTVRVPDAGLSQAHAQQSKVLRSAVPRRDVADRTPQKNKRGPLPALRKKYQTTPRASAKGKLNGSLG
jgi:hypothetical protein